MVVGYKLEKENRLKRVTDCGNVGANKGKPKDMGQMGDFDPKELSLILSICIARNGVDETVCHFDQVFDELRELSEKGIMFLYCNLFKQFTIKGKQLEFIRDIDKLISLR